MVELSFESLKFEDKGDFIRVKLYKIFYFDVPVSEFNKMDKKFKVVKGNLLFPKTGQAAANHKFGFLLLKHINDLKNSINQKSAIYIHKNSGIPLIGSNVFGIVDRNTSIIEIKPITGCNLDCIYCSVDEGKSSKKQRDFVVEKDYLVDELKKLIEFKGIDGIEVHIGTQGEPLLYDSMVDLVKDIKKIKQVKTISINTNGLLFTKSLVDKLVKAGLNQINLSVNTMDKKKASDIARVSYNMEHIIDIAKYISTKVNLRIAPVLMDDINEKDIPELIKFAKSINAKLGIQNYLYYSGGRKPCKQIEWDRFFDILKNLEKKHDVHLILNENDFNIIKTKKLIKPFKNDDVIEAKVMCLGRYKGQFICVFGERNVTVNSKKSLKIGCDVKVKIKRSKHNVFSGILI